MIIIGPFIENTLGSDCCPGSKTSWTVIAPEAKERVAGQRRCHLLVGSLCALERRSFSKAALLPSLLFGPNLFQLLSMNCRCPLLGRREEVRKPLTREPKAAAGLRAGWKVGPGSLFVAINTVWQCWCSARETGYSPKGACRLCTWGPVWREGGLDSKLIFHVTAFLVPVWAPREGGRLCCTNMTHNILSGSASAAAHWVH